MQQVVQATFWHSCFHGELTRCLAGAGAFLDLDLKTSLQFRVVWFRIHSIRCSAQNHGAFPLRSLLAEVGQCSPHVGAYLLFMAFGQFPGHLHRSLSTALLFEFLQQGQQPMGCFVDDGGACLAGDLG